MSRSLVSDFLKERLAVSRARTASALPLNRASRIDFTILFYYDETNKLESQRRDVLDES